MLNKNGPSHCVLPTGFKQKQKKKKNIDPTEGQPTSMVKMRFWRKMGSKTKRCFCYENMTSPRVKHEPSSARASSASTVSALNDPSNFQLALGDSANAVSSKVGVSCLDAAQAAQVLVALLLPLGYQVLVCIAFLYAVVVQLSADGFSFVEEVENVPTALMVQPEDRPQGLHLSLPLMRVRFSFSHFLVQLIQRGLDELPSVWRWLSAPLYFGHFDGLAGKKQTEAELKLLVFSIPQIGRAHV